MHSGAIIAAYWLDFQEWRRSRAPARRSGKSMVLKKGTAVRICGVRCRLKQDIEFEGEPAKRD